MDAYMLYHQHLPAGDGGEIDEAVDIVTTADGVD